MALLLMKCLAHTLRSTASARSRHCSYGPVEGKIHATRGEREVVRPTQAQVGQATQTDQSVIFPTHSLPHLAPQAWHCPCRRFLKLRGISVPFPISGGRSLYGAEDEFQSMRAGSKDRSGSLPLDLQTSQISWHSICPPHCETNTLAVIGRRPVALITCKE